MHRVRAGLTGLGLVFLVTLVGSLAMQPAGADFLRDERADPLAQLGVAPSLNGERKGSERRSLEPEEQPIADHLPPVTADQVLI
jgi:hypothetical protein